MQLKDCFQPQREVKSYSASALVDLEQLLLKVMTSKTKRLPRCSQMTSSC